METGTIEELMRGAMAQAFAEAIQAVEWSLCDVAEDCELFMAHRDFFVDAIRTRAASLNAKSEPCPAKAEQGVKNRN